MEAHVIDIVRKRKDDKEGETIGNLGTFVSSEEFDKAHKRAVENVLPRLMNYDKNSTFSILTYWIQLDSYNETWEFMKVKNLLK